MATRLERVQHADRPNRDAYWSVGNSGDKGPATFGCMEVSDILGKATEKLLSSVNEAVTTEMSTFCTERERAQLQSNTEN